MRIFNTKFGFTLIESLVYIGIFGVFFITVVQFTLNVQESNLNANHRKLISTNSMYVSNYLQDSFNNSTTVNNSVSVFDNTNGVLRIENGTDFFEFRLSNNILVVNKNGVEFQLLYDDVIVNSFKVEKVLDTASQISGIRISINYVSLKKTAITLALTTMYYLK